VGPGVGDGTGDGVGAGVGVASETGVPGGSNRVAEPACLVGGNWAGVKGEQASIRGVNASRKSA